MPDSLKNKILKHEVVPPASVWNKISEQLDQDFNAADATLSSKLENSEINPPAVAWDNISAELYDEAIIKEPARVIPLLYKRIAVAVILAGIVAVSVMYLFTGNGNPSFLNGTTAKNNQSIKYKPATSSGNQLIPSPASVIAERPQARLLPVQIAYHHAVSPIMEITDPTSSETDASGLEAIPETPYLPGVQSDLQPVSALNPVNIPAPLIRDASGHVIMDMKLITSGGNHFITVTSPNGAQTKISSKFLPCLSYLNDNRQAVPTDVEGIECSEKFAAWRDKLLSQPAYVPAADNFLDIFELQDLIQD